MKIYKTFHAGSMGKGFLSAAILFLSWAGVWAQPVIDWQKGLGGSFVETFTMIKQTSDGGYILGGTSNSSASGDKSASGSGGSDYWIVRLDGDGAILWESTIGGSSSEELGDICITSDGGFLLAGSSSSGISGDKTEASQGGFDIWLVKLDASGNIEWDKTLGGSSDELRIKGRETSTAGTYILGAMSASNISGDKTENSMGFQDYWVIKLDVTEPSPGTYNFSIAWQNTVGTSSVDIFQQVIETQSGDFLAGGNTGSGVNGDKSDASNGAQDYWIVLLDGSTGAVSWDNSIGGSSNDVLFNMTETASGDFLLSGSSSSGATGDKTAASFGSTDSWLVKTNSSGTVQWDKSLGGSGADNMTSVFELADGSILTGSLSSSSNTGNKKHKARGGYDYWLVRLNSSGNTILWQRTLGGTSDDEPGTVAETADGGYIIGGTSNSVLSGDKKNPNIRGNKDYWVIKMKQYDGPVPGAVSVCDISNSTLDPDITSVAYTYTWWIPNHPSPHTFVSSSQYPTVSPNVTTRYIVMVKDTMGDTVAYDSMDFLVKKCCEDNQTMYTKYHTNISSQFAIDQANRYDAGFTAAGDILMPSGYIFSPPAASGASNASVVVKMNANHNYEWSYRYDDPLSNECAQSVKEAADGDYVIAGWKGNPKLLYVQKIDKDGATVRWTKSYNQLNHTITFVSITELVDAGGTGTDNFVVTGVVDASGTSQLIVAGIDGNGNLQYYNDHTLSGRSNCELRDVTATRDGGFLVVGNSGYNTASPDYTGALLIKYDANGTALWEKVYRFPSRSGSYNLNSLSQHDRIQAFAQGVAEDPVNDKYVIVGHITDGANMNKGFIFEVDYNGDFINAATSMVSSASLYYTDVKVSASAQDYIVSGYSIASPAEKTILARFDQSLAQVYQHEFTNTSSTHNRGYSLHELANRDILLHGQTRNSLNTVGEPFVIRVDQNGQNNCENALTLLDTIVNLDSFYYARSSPNSASGNDISLAAGHFCGSSPDNCVPALMQVPKKTGTKAQPDPGQQVNQGRESSDIRMSLYPNPASSEVTVTLDDNISGAGMVSLVDYTGRTVMSHKLEPGQRNITLPVNSLPNGIYLVVLRQGAEVVASHKLVINR